MSIASVKFDLLQIQKQFRYKNKGFKIIKTKISYNTNKNKFGENMANRNAKEQRKYLKNNPLIYHKHLENQRKKYQENKIKELFKWIES